MPSVQDIQEQIRQSQQLVGTDASSQQQAFQPMGSGTHYAPFLPQTPFPFANIPSTQKPKDGLVSIGKFSLLSISLSLMLLGAFTFLGGFLLGIWVAGPKVSSDAVTYLPPQQSILYYPTGGAYPQTIGGQQGTSLEQNVSRHLGSAIESTIKDQNLQNMPTVLSPLAKVAQSQVGKYVGDKTEDFLRQQLKAIPHSSSLQPPPSVPVDTYASPSTEPAQLPVLTPQNKTSADSFPSIN